MSRTAPSIPQAGYSSGGFLAYRGRARMQKQRKDPPLSTGKAESDIRARRLLTNELIAAHAADRLKPFFDANATVIAGDGRVITGRDAVLAAFEAQFGDPEFIAYVRSTETVTTDRRGQRAGETGTWVGSWQGKGTPRGFQRRPPLGVSGSQARCGRDRGGGAGEP